MKDLPLFKQGIESLSEPYWVATKNVSKINSLLKNAKDRQKSLFIFTNNK
jgi:hypothetical protein